MQGWGKVKCVTLVCECSEQGEEGITVSGLGNLNRLITHQTLRASNIKPLRKPIYTGAGNIIFHAPRGS